MQRKQESKQEKVKKLENLLGGTFTAMTDQEMTDDTNPFLCVGQTGVCVFVLPMSCAHSGGACRQKYLDEHMGTEGKKEEEVDAKVMAQRSLYQIPAELQAHGKAGAAPDDDLGGAPMLHGTGIAEVSLPMEFKIKCIEVCSTRAGTLRWGLVVTVSLAHTGHGGGTQAVPVEATRVGGQAPAVKDAGQHDRQLQAAPG